MEEKNNNSEQTKTNDDSIHRNLGASFRDFVSILWNFSKDTLSFTDEVDKSATVKMIKSEIQFKGFNIWILIFSIIIASIGLNTNSTAVIIGAMLISPLMGPIMGVGLSLGTNDWGTLVTSFRALLITVFVSLVTSTLYFLITPFGEAGDELLGRTHPELRDVFIAIFGGLAGIMANTRNKATNVIPGVAIATALMPPLCTAGYGIATANWQFFSGAFYLFIINSVYIAITAFIVIRYLKFPLVHLMDEVKERRFKRYIFIFSIFCFKSSFHAGMTSSTFNKMGMIEDIEDTYFSSFDIGIYNDNIFTNSDSLGLEVYQPLRSERSNINFSIPVGRTKDRQILFQNLNLDLTPSGRQINSQLVYNAKSSNFSFFGKIGLVSNEFHQKENRMKPYFQFDVELSLE